MCIRDSIKNMPKDGDSSSDKPFKLDINYGESTTFAQRLIQFNIDFNLQHQGEYGIRPKGSDKPKDSDSITAEHGSSITAEHGESTQGTIINEKTPSASSSNWGTDPELEAETRAMVRALGVP